jgi:hypothetical protein
MKTSYDVTIWIGDDVSLTHQVNGGVHTITLSGDESSRIAVQFLDGFDGLVSFRDEISRVVADWVPPTPDEDAPRNMTDPCEECLDGQKTGWNLFAKCSACGKTWPF